MPFALMHSATGELLSCTQVNGYRLKYFGILLWPEMPDAEERLAALLRAERYGPEQTEGGAAAPSGNGAGADGAKPRRIDRHAAEWEQVLELSRWQPVLLSEHEAKLANVRLRNDPAFRLYLREGRLEAVAIRP